MASAAGSGGGPRVGAGMPGRGWHAGETAVGPLPLEPILLEKVWGGRSLSALGKPLPPGDIKIGESWELADLPGTSVSGAGGGAFRSRICDAEWARPWVGRWAGRTLQEVIASAGWEAVVGGDAGGEGSGGGADGAGRDYPLLVKFLDAAEALSVQVHPSRAYAASRPGVSVKTECWTILAAKPGAEMYIGLNPGVVPAELARAVRAAASGQGGGGTILGVMGGGMASVTSLLRRVPAVVGECHTLPSGIVHALGAGVVVAEVQSPSDTTYRLYDWGRAGRPMHVEEGLAAIDWEARCTTRALASGVGGAGARALLAETEFFTVEHEIFAAAPPRNSAAADAQADTAAGTVRRGNVLMLLSGAMQISPAADGASKDALLGVGPALGAGSQAGLPVEAGRTVVLPPRPWRLRATGGQDASALIVTLK